jgi:hypothetical protein
MATYGLTTYKEDGTTVVLTNSTKSGVFGEAYQYSKTGTAGTKPPVSFPQYAGRTIRPMQLLPGAHSWSVSYPSGIPTITFVENEPIAASIPQFYYESTILYIFVK